MSRTGVIASVFTAAVYAVSLLHLQRTGAYPLEEALAILVVLGFGFSALAWAATIGVTRQELRVEAPLAQLLLAAVLLAACVFYLVELRTWTNDLVPDAGHGGSDLLHAAAKTATKLIVFVLLPYWAFYAVFGLRWRDFGLSAQSFRRLLGRDGFAVVVVGAAIIAFQFYAGSQAAPFREGRIATEVLVVGLPLAFAWLVAEVGLTEEFFFRAIVQERLSAALKSDVAGLMLMALIFGLVHAPGIVLRGAGVGEGLGENPDAWTAAAYTVAVHAVAAFVFGVLWLRTRNLIVVMLVHAAIDLLSNGMELMTAFGLIARQG